MKLLKFVLYCSLGFFSKTFEVLFNTLLVQDGLICYDVGWLSWLKEGDDSNYEVDIGLCDIVEGMGTNNQVAPSHGVPIISSIIVVYGGGIT